MQNENKIKVLLTAGHAATTAYSLFERITEDMKNWEVIWIGTKTAIEGSRVTTLEHKIFSGLKIKNFSIFSGRLQRRFGIWTIPSLFKLPIGFFQSLSILIKERPDVIVSFGGHVSIPVSFAGFILGIPIIVHEQTAAGGLANRIVGILAKRVAISRETSFDYFPRRKTILIGNLVRSEFTNVKPKVKMSAPPVVYITGGSRGSQILNESVLDILKELLSKYFIIHQTGEVDFEKFRNERNKLSGVAAQRYKVAPSFSTEEVVDIFKKADIVVSRAGANTVSEIIVARKPSVLIPIPWVQESEQLKNAQIAVDAGLSLVLTEDELTGESLLEKIEFIRAHWDSFSKNSERGIESLDRNASGEMVKLIEEVVK